MTAHQILEEVTQPLTRMHRERLQEDLGISLLLVASGLSANPVAVLEEAMEAARIEAPERSYYKYKFRRALVDHTQELVWELAA